MRVLGFRSLCRSSCFGFWLALAASADAATFALSPPVADALVSSANPTNNYGGAGANAVAGSATAKGEFQSVIRWDTSTAKTNFDGIFGAGLWTVQSISLQMTASAPMPQNPVFNLPSVAGKFSLDWMQNDTWTEGSGVPLAPAANGITWNTLPSFLSGSDQFLGTYDGGATSGNFTFDLGLASGLVGDIAAGGLAGMRMYTTDTAMAGLFNSRSFQTASSRPILTITAVAVPEPSSWLLAALGMAALALVRRRIGR